MKLYQMKWWERLFKKPHSKKVDSVKDLTAIKEFLQEVNNDTQYLLPLLEQLEELEKEREVGKQGVVQVNLETQAKVLDDVLKRYEFFENDADINGIRIRNVAKQVLRHAKKAGMKDLVKEKSGSWQYH